jgi:biopolymer transport protein ExbB
LALALILAKLFQFYRSGVFRRAPLKQVLGVVRDGNAKEALLILRTTDGPAARILRAALECCLDPKLDARVTTAEVTRVGQAEARGLENYLRPLSAIGNLSPLLGLLGTIIGIIHAFAALQSAGGRASPALLAGGIWEALLNTVFGLVIAIFALAAFYFFEGLVEARLADAKDAVTQLLLHFGKLGGEAEAEEIVRGSSHGV